MGRFKTLAEVIAANKQLGHHFFDYGNIIFFESLIHEETFMHDTFITSENIPLVGRRYTVREADFAGEIKSPLKDSYDTLLEAMEAQEQYTSRQPFATKK